MDQDANKTVKHVMVGFPAVKLRISGFFHRLCVKMPCRTAVYRQFFNAGNPATRF
jgi:hypothetical protein